MHPQCYPCFIGHLLRFTSACGTLFLTRLSSAIAWGNCTPLERSWWMSSLRGRVPSTGAVSITLAVGAGPTSAFVTGDSSISFNLCVRYGFLIVVTRPTRTPASASETPCAPFCSVPMENYPLSLCHRSCCIHGAAVWLSIWNVWGGGKMGTPILLSMAEIL